MATCHCPPRTRLMEAIPLKKRNHSPFFWTPPELALRRGLFFLPRALEPYRRPAFAGTGDPDPGTSTSLDVRVRSAGPAGGNGASISSWSTEGGADG